MTQGLAELDFTIGCDCAKEFNDGVACVAAAAWFVEIHPIDWCDRIEVNEDRNTMGFLCDEHLRLYERKATDEARALNPTGHTRLWRASRPYCQSCRKSIQTGTDILQIAVTL